MTNTMPKTLNSLIASVVRKDVIAMNAYHVPDATGMLKLDAMESPYQWPDELISEWQKRLSTVSVNRYPDPQATAVKDRLREAVSLQPQYDILLGNGSDEIIQILIQAIAKEGAVVMSPEPSFVMFRILSEINRVNYVGVDLNDDFSLNLPAMLQAIQINQPALLFLAQPNNPTGNLYGITQVEAIIEASSGLVVIDEAYTAFTESDHLGLLDRFDNVVIMRTVSKVGLAGLRLGMLYAKQEWINEFDKIRLPYNINTLTQLSSDFAIEHFDSFLALATTIKIQRELMMSQLSNIDGLMVMPSEANFIVVKLEEKKASDIHQLLIAQQILVKCLSGGHRLLDNCLRITVSSAKENAILISVLAGLLGD